ncbi:MAG: DNA-binding response regulator [Bacteroidetes bacterium]|jgi:DNA-binding LytR/AlgR family response regulator|nr:DNA-binding response regulator [Bacteroidota bacterium]
MIRCIVIDDEPMALEVIKTFCDKIPFVDLVQSFTQVSRAKAYLQNFPVDLIFLDIQMPDVNGIDFYKGINQEKMVIFTTAFSEYAVEGFNLSAVDYLLKPIEFKRFEAACAKANDYFGYTRAKKTPEESFLYVRSEYALVKISFSDILYLETLDDYIKIHQAGKKPVLTLMSMKKMLEKLPESEFVRVHRSYIVPFRKIGSVRSKSIFLEGIEIPIGNSFEKNFSARYAEQKN